MVDFRENVGVQRAKYFRQNGLTCHKEAVKIAAGAMCLDFVSVSMAPEVLSTVTQVVWNMNTVRGTQNSDRLLKKALS